MNYSSLSLEEVVQALRELGGEALWDSIKERVTQNRGGGFEPYLDWRNYNTTMFQLIQQHCRGYKKFRGDVHFEKVGKNRFRLTDTPRSSRPQPTSPAIRQSKSDIPVESVDINSPPERFLSTTYRVLRDMRITIAIKKLHNYRCQICLAEGIKLNNGQLYAEAHHIKPLGSPHDGPDDPSNILSVCPKCHVLLDYGVIKIDLSIIEIIPKHQVNAQFIDYHNRKIFQE